MLCLHLVLTVSKDPSTSAIVSASGGSVTARTTQSERAGGAARTSTGGSGRQVQDLKGDPVGVKAQKLPRATVCVRTLVAPWSQGHPPPAYLSRGVKRSKHCGSTLSSEPEEERLAAEEARQQAEAARLRAEEEELRRVEEAGELRQPRNPVVPPLSDDWVARAQSTLDARLNAELARTPEGSPLTRKDFETVVTPNQWLNDEIINGTLLHLANYINQKAGIKNTRLQTPKVQVFNSFFGKKIYENGGEGTERQMRRTGIRKDTFLDIEAVLIPICRGAHWTLVVVRPKYRQAHHFDSLSGAGNPGLITNAMKWVKMVLEDRFVPSEWTTTTIPSPRQRNFDDCGVHTITNGICVAMHVDPMSYSAGDMELQRLHIAAVLLNDGFKGDLSLDGF
jgi:Ulp1 family protease